MLEFIKKMNFLKINNLKNLSLNELGLWLLIPLASLSSRTWLPFPPTMLLLLGAILCWIVLQMQSRHVGRSRDISQKQVDSSTTLGMTANSVIIVVGAFMLYIFASQYFMGTSFFRYMGVVFSAMYLVLILDFSKDVSFDFLKNLGNKFIRYSIIILCIEAVLRFAWSTWLIIHGDNIYWSFYQFKFYGPMYAASNMLAGHIIALLFFILWWGKTQQKSMKKEFFITLILLFLTFSRASIPAVFIGLSYYVFFKNLNWKKSLWVFLTFGILGAFALFGLKQLIADFSFQSKFLIFDEFIDYYEVASWKNILFGLGLSEPYQMEEFTFTAHNYFLLFLSETGVFGLLFLLITFFFFVKATNGAAMVVLVPYFVQISSEGATFIPYFYVIMTLMILLNFLKNDTQKNSLLLD
jgi:hypothetical protein